MNINAKVILTLKNCDEKRKKELQTNLIKDATYFEGKILNINDETNIVTVEWYNLASHTVYHMNKNELLLYSRFIDGRDNFKIKQGGKRVRKLRKSRKVFKSGKTSRRVGAGLPI